MCDKTIPRECTLERRFELRREHIQRHDALGDMAYRLGESGAISEAERDLLYAKAEAEWDDAIHIASPDDPLRSLCGSYGRNLADLPGRPDTGSGCWTCLTLADELAPTAKELITA